MAQQTSLATELHTLALSKWEDEAAKLITKCKDAATDGKLCIVVAGGVNEALQALLKGHGFTITPVANFDATAASMQHKISW